MMVVEKKDERSTGQTTTKATINEHHMTRSTEDSRYFK